MKQEDKELLLKDLCARLPYGVKVEVTILETNKVIVEEFDYMWLGILYSENPHHMIKPYLRPMSSMTEEEEGRYNLLQGLSHLAEQHWTANDGNVCKYSDAMDFLNSHHFDYRGLIEKGLALEAPEGMYNIKD